MSFSSSELHLALSFCSLASVHQLSSASWPHRARPFYSKKPVVMSLAQLVSIRFQTEHSWSWWMTLQVILCWARLIPTQNNKLHTTLTFSQLPHSSPRDAFIHSLRMEIVNASPCPHKGSMARYLMLLVIGSLALSLLPPLRTSSVVVALPSLFSKCHSSYS